jgi:Ca2+-transporting ATPase
MESKFEERSDANASSWSGLPPEGQLQEQIGRPRRQQVQRDVLRAAAFARVTPRQKLDLVRLYQHHGCVVAMTGDGVNDAPALKQADIGIAMGERGTQVAREAADMILCDDAFSTIVTAVGQGRIIFDNIRAFIRYLISCNVSEVLVVFLAAVAGAPLPILPLQILFLNLVTDVFPALALGLGEGTPLLMRERPRDPREPFLTRRHWLGIGAYGSVIAAAVLGALATAVLHLRLPEGEAVTVSFLRLAMAQLWHVFNMRVVGSGVLRNAVTRNPYAWGALVLCMGLLLGAVYLPGLNVVLETRTPGARGWLLAIGMSMIPLTVGQVALRVRRRSGRAASSPRPQPRSAADLPRQEAVVGGRNGSPADTSAIPRYCRHCVPGALDGQ